MGELRTVVIGIHWHDLRSELSFVTRSLAGAASRLGPVDVLVPGVPGQALADGAFDLVGMGLSGELRWPSDLPTECTVVVDEMTPAATRLLGEVSPRRVLSLSASAGAGPPAGWEMVRVAPVGSRDESGHDAVPVAAVHVPVNPVAQTQRHHGFGFVGYLLVLPGPSRTVGAVPTTAAWLTAALHDANVVVVQDGTAAVWRGRALRGQVSVDTRMDFWRLLAHAALCVDLAPGSFVARECVEALRLGTPIVVPSGSDPAAVHAAESGGAEFGDPGELVDAVARLCREPYRTETSLRGRAYADASHGDPVAFTARVRSVFFPP